MGISTPVRLNCSIDMPVLGIGTWQLSSDEAEKATLWALEAGYRLVDTAEIYGNEAAVGRAIKKSGIPREEIFVTTKLWNDSHADVEGALSESLGRLKLDHVDLYLMHFPVPQRLDSWKVMEKLCHRKLCRSIGVSNFTVRHLKGLLEVAEVPPAVNQVEFSPFLYQKDLLDFCNSKKIQVEAYSPLTHGHRLQDRKLLAVAAKYEKSAAQLLIRWALQHSLVVVPKSKTKSRIVENADVFDFHIEDSDMRLLDSLDEGYRTCWDPTNAP